MKGEALMKKYETPNIIVVRFSAQDILTFSNEFDLPAVPIDDNDQE